MDPGPPLLQPIEDSDLISDKTKVNGLSNGGQSPQMPILFQADKETNNSMNIQDLFSTLNVDEQNITGNNKQNKTSEPDSFFEKMYKDFGNFNNFDINIEPVLIQNKEENTVNSKIDIKDESKLMPKKSSNQNSKNLKKTRKRKVEKVDFSENYVEESDLMKLGIKNTKIKRISRTDVSNDVKTQPENKLLKSPFIIPRSSLTSPKKTIKSINIISSDYELVNPAFKSNKDYNSTSIYRPNLKNLHSNHISNISQSCYQVCAFCGQKPDFLDLGYMYGPYFIDSNIVQSLPLPCIFPSDEGQENGIGLSGKSAIKPNSEGLKLIIQSGNTQKRHNRTDYRITWSGELWFHRECVLWAPGTFLRGDGKIGGLEESLKLALNAECFICNKVGAILNCTTKSCDKNFHYYCAVCNDSKMNEDQLTILCKKHKDR